MKAEPLRLLIDGIGLAPDGAASHPWLKLAAWLGACDALNVYWLDRGHAPDAAGIGYIPFPSHRRGACAADSLLIQQVCDHYRIDVFSSTGWTTPVATPMFMLVDERLLDGPTERLPQHTQQEQELALAFAQHYLCASTPIRAALLARHPEISPRDASTARQDWRLLPDLQLLPELGEQVVALCTPLSAEGRSKLHAPFFAEWRRLRQLQSTVDA